MRIGVMLSTPTTDGNAIDELVKQAETAAASGVAGVWLGQTYDMDALTALAVIGRAVPDIEVGTAVVPTWVRHPIVLSSQAQTIQVASRGRLTLGVGLSHRNSLERYGLAFDRPVRHLREYLTALQSLLRTGEVDLHGDLITATTVGFPARFADTFPPVPVLVGALGPQLLRVTGELADGTITWMVGPRTLAEHVTVELGRAAAAAGRPSPRVIAGLPVCVTSDIAGARERAATALAFYANIPSYRAMLDREGAAPADLAVIGDEDTVAAAITRWSGYGATDILANTAFATAAERQRTWRLLGSLR
jgi:F420-dependent oxidoreductase-like protein